MKRIRFVVPFLFFLSMFPVFPQLQPSENVPALLEGIWQGKERLLMFSGGSEFAVVLRVFYQWYNDRAAEPSSFAEVKSRDRNNASASEPENISVSFITVSENLSRTAGIYWLSVKYPYNKESCLIPVCVIDGKLYLDFLIKVSDSDPYKAMNVENAALLNSSGSLSSSSFAPQGKKSAEFDFDSGFYRAASSVAASSGITIAPPVFKKEVFSYFINGGDIYKIRYWLSEMDYSSEKASFTDEESGAKIFSVDKFLKIGSDLYQCTTGRSTKIRNIEKSSRPKKKLTFDADKMFVALGDPYLEKVPGKSGSEDLLENVAENNKRRKPAPKPIFPPSEINFHWKDISELEKYNPYTWNRRNLDVNK